MKGRTQEIIGLQYLRGLAAVAVIVDHAAGMAALPKYFGQEVLGGSLRSGAVGVDLFFLISGFIISTVSLNRDLSPAIVRRRFAWRRFVRIIPLMWVAILSYAALRLLGRGQSAGDAYSYVRALFLIPWGDVDPDVIWTLRHEAIFYLLFALCFLGRRSIRPMIILWVLAPFAYSALSLPAEPSLPWLQLVRNVCYSVNIEFGLGLLIGLLWLRERGKPVQVRAEAFLVLTASMIALVVFASFIHLNRSSVWKTMLVAGACAPVLILGLRITCPSNALGRIGHLLGNASYSMYLFHLHIQSALLGWMNKVVPAMPVGVVIVVVTLCAVVGTVLIHICLEKPLLRLLTTRRPNPA